MSHKLPVDEPIVAYGLVDLQGDLYAKTLRFDARKSIAEGLGVDAGDPKMEACQTFLEKSGLRLAKFKLIELE